MKMKYLETHLHNADYNKDMGDRYNQWAPIEENVPFYKSIMELGFMNSFSYYSLIQHERYVLVHGDKTVFLWRNGREDYFAEFSDETLIDRISKVMDFPVSMCDNVIQFQFFSPNILKTFVDEFKK